MRIEGLTAAPPLGFSARRSLRLRDGVVGCCGNGGTLLAFGVPHACSHAVGQTGRRRGNIPITASHAMLTELIIRERSTPDVNSRRENIFVGVGGGAVGLERSGTGRRGCLGMARGYGWSWRGSERGEGRLRWAGEGVEEGGMGGSHGEGWQKSLRGLGFVAIRSGRREGEGSRRGRRR